MAYIAISGRRLHVEDAYRGSFELAFVCPFLKRASRRRAAWNSRSRIVLIGRLSFSRDALGESVEEGLREGFAVGSVDQASPLCTRVNKSN